MKLARDRRELDRLLAPLRDRRLALVPTMGNLHAGHLALVDEAHRRADQVLASIFVNPKQFGPGEDFDAYPRTPEADLEQLAAAGCELVYLPGTDDLYPFGPAASVQVHVPGLSDVLCGAARPGHFDGVATVVSKLLLAVRPEVAVFGRKDYQQLRVIERLVEDLGFPVEIVGCATVREADGLAMSSRNAYLEPAERARAAALHAGLQAVAAGLEQGQAPELARRLGEEVLAEQGLRPEYLEIRRREDLAPPRSEDRELVILVAARLGRARLIDNLEAERPPPPD